MRIPYRVAGWLNACRRAAYALGPPPHPGPAAFDGSFDSTRKLFLYLIESLHRTSWDEKKASFRLVRPLQRSFASAGGDEMELGARSFIGAAYFLGREDRADLRERYLEFVRRGVDPSSAGHWGRIGSDQALVENTSVILGFLLNPDALWRRLSASDQKNFQDHIAACAARPFLENNWLWFKVFHLLFLEATAGQPRQAEIQELLERIGSFYDGEGWYSDGRQADERRYDHYNAWAMHYYGLLFCRLADTRYDELKHVLKERAKDFYKTYLPFFPAHGAPIAWGRSLVYRFGMLGFFALYLSEGLAQESDYPVIKQLTVSTMRAFLRRPIFDADGRLSLGYFRPCAALLEPYNAPGSPYWAFKFFAFFLLDASHPYWNVPAAGGTARPDVLVRSIGVSVRGTAGHRLLLNGSGASRLYTWKYAKFAYSDTFGQTLEPRYPDNGFIFKRGGLEGGRDSVREFRVTSDGLLQTRWGVRALPDVEVHSTLMALDGGYLLVCEISCTRPLVCRFHGFALAKGVSSAARSPKEIRLASERGVSLLGVFHGKPGRFGIRRVARGRTLEGTDVALPFYEASLGDGVTRLVIRVQAGYETQPAAVDVDSAGPGVAVRRDGAVRLLEKKGRYYE